MANKTPTHPLPNLEKISATVWVVRTQAGFNKLIREFRREEKAESGSPLELTHYPSVYPSVIRITQNFRITQNYRGYFYYSAEIFDLKKYCAARAKELKLLEHHRDFKL